MEKIRRTKRSEAAWRELFARQAQSGLRVSQFCQGEGINAGVFRHWRARLHVATPIGLADHCSKHKNQRTLDINTSIRLMEILRQSGNAGRQRRATAGARQDTQVHQGTRGPGIEP